MGLPGVSSTSLSRNVAAVVSPSSRWYSSGGTRSKRRFPPRSVRSSADISPPDLPWKSVRYRTPAPYATAQKTGRGTQIANPARQPTTARTHPPDPCEPTKGKAGDSPPHRPVALPPGASPEPAPVPHRQPKTSKHPDPYRQSQWVTSDALAPSDLDAERRRGVQYCSARASPNPTSGGVA